MIKTTIATIGATIAIVAAVWNGREILDSRHVLRTEFAPVTNAIDDITYTSLKREIRELKTAIANEQNPARRAELELDLSDAIDRLCRQFPDDREC